MDDKKDFFISYNKQDRSWAEWVAWHLEEAGYTTVVQAWDFRPGSNFVMSMQQASVQARRTVAVLSPDYLASQFVQPEWAAAFAQDPTGQKGLLVPLRVRACDLEGLLPQIVYVDLMGLGEEEARAALLDGMKRERAKPSRPPAFPGAQTGHGMRAEPGFPGPAPIPGMEQSSAPAASFPARQDASAPALGRAGSVSSPADSEQVSDTGDWLLLDGQFFRARSVADREKGVEVQVAVQTSAENAALEALRPGRSRRSETLRYSHRDDAFLAKVQSAERTTAAGASVWTIVLIRPEPTYHSLMEVTFNGVTPDKIAELRARLLLLNETPQGRYDDRMLASAIEGYNNPAQVKEGLFPALWKEHQDQADAMPPFLIRARLWAVYTLKASFTCEHILELTLGPLHNGVLSVRFHGRRHRAYDNVEPAEIEVEGTCVLTAPKKR